MLFLRVDAIDPSFHRQITYANVSLRYSSLGAEPNELLSTFVLAVDGLQRLTGVRPEVGDLYPMTIGKPAS